MKKEPWHAFSLRGVSRFPIFLGKGENALSRFAESLAEKRFIFLAVLVTLVLCALAVVSLLHTFQG